MGSPPLFSPKKGGRVGTPLLNCPKPEKMHTVTIDQATDGDSSSHMQKHSLHGATSQVLLRETSLVELVRQLAVFFLEGKQRDMWMLLNKNHCSTLTTNQSSNSKTFLKKREDNSLHTSSLRGSSKPVEISSAPASPAQQGQHRILVLHGLAPDDKILPSTRRYHQHCKLTDTFKIPLEKTSTSPAKPTKKG